MLGVLKLRIVPLFFAFVFFSLLCLGVAAAFVSPELEAQVDARGSAPALIVFEAPVSDAVSAPATSASLTQSSSQAAPLTETYWVLQTRSNPTPQVLRPVSSASKLVLKVNISAESLDALRSVSEVSGVYYDRPVFAMDAASNAQIRADLVQRTVFRGSNLTGVNQTICVIDTGIDYSHESLGSCAGFVRSLSDNETILFSSNDTLSLSTGQASFYTSATDTRTVDQSYVRFISSRVDAFSFEQYTLIAYSDEYTFESITVDRANEFYVVTDNRSAGNSTQGLVFYRRPTTGLFVPYFDYYATGAVTFSPPLNTLEIIWTRNIYVYPQNVSGCAFPPAGTQLYGSNLAHNRLTPLENFTLTGGKPVSYGFKQFTGEYSGNLTVLASGLNSSCSGTAVLQFNSWKGVLLPGLGVPSVRYYVENNYVPYHTTRGLRKIRVFAPGISLGAQEPISVHSVWIPEPNPAEQGVESAWSFDIGYGDASTPHLAPSNGTAFAGYSQSYTRELQLPQSAIQAGFVSPQKSVLSQLSLAAATLVYVDSSNATTVESGHPYGDQDDLRYVIRRPGFSSISLHFVNLSVEAYFDNVYLEYPNGTSIVNYTGSRRNFWTPAASGDTVVVRLKSDIFGNAYGFYIDRVSNSTLQPTERWACPRVLAAADFISGGEGIDDNGHGTHVAGIAAANGSITGVAPSAQLVSAKVLNSFGGGYSSNIISGLDWCVTNKNNYNISVITMSLGSYDTSSTFCDSDPMAQAIRRADDAGIFVSVASGNSYNASGVSYPACSSRALAVGAVNSTDSVASFSNAWNLPLVLAPGVDILSTYLNNQVLRQSGTSMAAPHVAGLAALMQDFSVRANGTRVLPAYLRQSLIQSSVPVIDFRNNRSYPRIDAQAAIASLKAAFSPRNLTLVSFANGSLSGDNYSLVNVTFFDDGPLASCTLEWNNGTTSNYSMELYAGYCSFNVTRQSDSNASGRIFMNDTFGNAATLSFVRQFNMRPRLFGLDLQNNTVLTTTSVFLTGTFEDSDASACTFYLSGVNNQSLPVNQRVVVPNVSTCAANFDNMTEGNYAAWFSVNDSVGQRVESGRTYFSIDRTPPTSPQFLAPSPANQSVTSQSTLVFNASFTDANPRSCTLMLDGISVASNVSSLNGTSYCRALVENLTDATHAAYYIVNDSAGFSNKSGLLSFTVKTQPPAAVQFIAPTPSNGSALNTTSIIVNFTWVDSNFSSCWLVVDNRTLFASNQSQPVTSYCATNLTLSDGVHSVIAFVNDSAGNSNSSDALTITTDTLAPSRPLLSVQPRTSGFAFLNWSAASDNIALDHYEIIRNNTRLASLPVTSLNYSDRAVASGFTYEYFVAALDRAANVNNSAKAAVFINDTVPPRQVTNLSAKNLPDGSVNLTWSASALDQAGELEQNVTYLIYRTDNASNPILTASQLFFAAAISSNATLLGNTTHLYWVDSAILSTNATYYYAVLAFDGSRNSNASYSTNNSVTQTTATSCTSTFTEYSACSSGSQSRTRTCFGQTETQTQSCTVFSGGSSSSSSSGSSSSSSSSSSTSATTTSTSNGARGSGGAAGGSGNKLFVVESLPGVVDFSRNAPASTKFTISSFYTGYLRYLNFTLRGIPAEWYEVLGPTAVTPISKTDFWISWRIPQTAQGRYPVTLEISGVGTKTAGLLKTNYTFELLLSQSAQKTTQRQPTASNTGSFGQDIFAPLSSAPQTLSNLSPSLLSGAITLASVQFSDAIFLAILLLVGVGGYAWVQARPRKLRF